MAFAGGKLRILWDSWISWLCLCFLVFFLWFFALFRDFLAFLGKFRTVKSLSFRSKSLPFLLPGQSFRAKSLSLDFRGFFVIIEDFRGAFCSFFWFFRIERLFWGPYGALCHFYALRSVLLDRSQAWSGNGAWNYNALPDQLLYGPGPVLLLVEVNPSWSVKGPGTSTTIGRNNPSWSVKGPGASTKIGRNQRSSADPAGRCLFRNPNQANLRITEQDPQ